MKTLFATLSLACAGFLMAGAASAADAPAAAASGAAACRADIEKLCPGMTPGDGKIKACMKEHRKDLSPECKKEISEARKAKKG